ncbi:MAG: UDP-N-acetylmuramoyl-tripeptide--D-alanyl-D-alanine ligase, partial [Candidatus Krumholzibacteriota bacterium]|nr:UDP-N-acetylmuramoyl-tripeptide--D-alanyl-D-alanine ligase [Candidatus Krumholzibacteriota bacterium]
MVIKVELAWIAESLKKAGYRGREEINGTIDGITIDTRRDCRGKMFVALSGEVRDGHDFLEQAVEKGAGALLIARERQAETERLNGSAVIFAVPDTLKGLQRLASSWREEVGPRVIGITGSTGKTGTKEIANLVFSKVYRTHATAGNYNNHIGLPLTLLSMERDTEICLAEMGANHRKEIDTLCRIARPSMGVITNIGPAHLEYFGDLKGVARAKAELIESLEEGDTAILPADDEFIEFLRDRTRARIKTFGLGEKADYRIEDIENRQEGGGYRFRIAGTAMEMTVYGRHHILNGAAAAAAALEM